MKKATFWLGLAALAALAGVIVLMAGTRAGIRPPAPAPQAESTQALPLPLATKEPQPEQKQAEIRLLGDAELVLEYGEDFSDPGAEAWLLNADGSRGAALEIRSEPALDTAKLGETEIVYSALRGSEILGSATRRVTVRDTVAPVISLPGTDGREVSALDNADGDITDRVQRTEEADRIVFTVRDSSGNEASEVRLKVPTISFEGGDHVQIPADYRFIDPGFTATDVYGRDLSDRVQIEGKITPWKLGTYELTYSVTDDEGRSASAGRTIEVVKAEMPETVLLEKTIYLTFDDGPAGPTEELLDMLAKYPEVKVTFFVTNTDPRYTDMIGREYRDGHSVGLHAYAHDASKIYTSEEDYFYYFDLMEEIIYQQTGEYTRLVRFVGGSSNTSSTYFSAGIMSRLAEDLTNMGYRYYDWNLQPENEACNFNVAFQHIKANAEYICREGVAVPISLQHDTAGWNIAVVEAVIQWGLANGYSFKGIDMTTPEWHHNIRN